MIIANSELDIISADDNYREFVYEDSAPTVFANIHPDDQHLLYEMVETLSRKTEASLCFRVCDKYGEYNWMSANCSRSPETGEGHITIALQDLSNLEKGKKAIELDYLTGLLNKKTITDIAQNLCSPDNEQHIVNLCILDIDNFKQVNDVYGHSFGDQVLKEVSEIIKTVLGEAGRAGRIGGDEIMMIIENVEEKTDLRVFLKSIRERVESLHIDENGLPIVTVSIGVGTYPKFVSNYDNLFRLADRMLYRAKKRGKNRYVIYNPDIHGFIVNGELDETTTVINNASAIDKTKLVLSSMDGLLVDNTESISSLLKKIIGTYDLDEVYVFFKDMTKSYYGHKKIYDSVPGTEDKVYKIVDSESDLSYAKEIGFNNKFNANGVLVVDMPKKNLENFPEAIAFFEEHGIQHAFLYRMVNVGFDGYIAIYNTREITRKFPQPDVTDLTYLSKMIEIALKSR